VAGRRRRLDGLTASVAISAESLISMLSSTARIVVASAALGVYVAGARGPASLMVPSIHDSPDLIEVSVGGLLADDVADA
jgi:hypothetical protein